MNDNFVNHAETFTFFFGQKTFTCYSKLISVQLFLIFGMENIIPIFHLAMWIN